MRDIADSGKGAESFLYHDRSSAIRSSIPSDIFFAKDLIIDVAAGKLAKAYPSAILVQHGVVQGHIADGPIAITW